MRERPSPPRVLRQRLARCARELDGGASRQGAERVDPARLDDERLRERLAGLVAQNPLVEPHRARQPPRRAHGDVAERPRGEPEVDGERRPEAHRPRGRRRLHAERRHLHDLGPRAWARQHGLARHAEANGRAAGGGQPQRLLDGGDVAAVVHPAQRDLVQVERARPVARGPGVERGREEDRERGHREPRPLRPSAPAQHAEVHHAHHDHVRDQRQPHRGERGKHERARQAPPHPGRLRAVVRPRRPARLALPRHHARREEPVERGAAEAGHARHTALADRLRAAGLAPAIGGEEAGVGEAVLDEHHAPAVAREPLQGAARLDVAQRARHHHRPGRLPTPPDDRRLAHDDEGQRPALGHAVLVRPREAHAGLRLAARGVVVAEQRDELAGHDRLAGDRVLRHAHHRAAGARGDLDTVAGARDEDRQIEHAALTGAERDPGHERVRGVGAVLVGAKRAERQLEGLRLRGGIRHAHARGHDTRSPRHVALEPDGLDGHGGPRRREGRQRPEARAEQAERGAPRAHSPGPPWGDARETARPR